MTSCTEVKRVPGSRATIERVGVGDAAEHLIRGQLESGSVRERVRSSGGKLLDCGRSRLKQGQGGFA